MDETSAPASPPAHRRRLAMLSAAAVLVLAIGAYLIAWAIAPTENASGQCTGIGWGCVPSPKDTLALLGIIIGPPALLATLVLGLFAIAALLRWTRWPGVLAGLVGIVVAAVIALLGSVLVVGVLL
ncbi:hypothetical protein [Brachybacterium hainanense]|uniref:Uncharacterized protein n=1 Tax=Brachybacterium hainanense TaxID=1541174 RepID=A0ABV6R8F7_9MICO